ncbi:DUF2069 domain-containing protein [Reinekea marinisedimentorum]|uniref:Putative membrane protein DUF2069 n=1 Tax=Reinekea marinisedimentorum TaxID=230495 RepID=A0A4R3I921_9GAMM|nr:DUF2069 domain-containing protein [Reinekea marinisedimentorum]TCS42644.1 putative membrane protein DUF2069 [Reinekea marinisedimentorum]
MSNAQLNLNKQIRLHFFLLMAAAIAGTFLSGPSINSMPTLQWVVSGLLFGFMAVLPLLFFIPTVLKPTVRSLSWMGFMLLAYLVWGIVKTFTPGGLIGGLLICTFNITTFFYIILWLRPFKKQAKARKKAENR